MFINVVSTRIRFAYDNEKHFNSHTVINCVRIDKLRDATHISARRIFEENNPKIAEKFNMIFLLTLLNSKLLNWYFLSFQSEGLHFYPDDAKKLPIFNIVNKEEQLPLIYLGNRMLELTKEKDNLLRKFLRYCSKFTQSEIYPKTLQSWNQLDFSDFIKELNIAIKASNKERTKEGLSPVLQLTKKDEFEWMELFEENKKKALEREREIEKTDKEIDRMVYKLYGLTEEEIGIVENT